MTTSITTACMSELNTTIERAIELRQFVRANDALFADIEAFSTGTYHSLCCGRLYLYLTIPVNAFTAYAEPDLSCVLDGLVDLLNCWPTTHDTPGMAMRTYMFQPPELPLVVNLTAQLRPNSPACQQVVVGSKKVVRRVDVEVDELIFAFKC